jgi:hypothetical protein
VNWEGVEPTDDLAQSLSQSLDPKGSRTAIVIVPGLLKEVVRLEGLSDPHGVPPPDEDYSSWGNEVLWQW